MLVPLSTCQNVLAPLSTCQNVHMLISLHRVTGEVYCVTSVSFSEGGLVDVLEGAESLLGKGVSAHLSHIRISLLLRVCG